MGEDGAKRTGLGQGGITCVLQTQFSSFLFYFEGLEKGVFGSPVYLDLFIVAVCSQTRLAEPSVRHFSGDWERFPLVTTADDLDAPTLEPAKKGFQGRAGHRAELILDDHMGNEFLPHPFECPLCLTTPAEKAVIGLGLDAPGPHLFGQTMGRGEDEVISLAKQFNRSRDFAAPPPPFR